MNVQILDLEGVATLADKLDNIPANAVLLVECDPDLPFNPDQRAYWVPTSVSDAQWEEGFIFFQTSLVLGRWLPMCSELDCIQWVIDQVNRYRW